MDLSIVLVDLIRIAHLICFAAGMGMALFLDVRSFWRLNLPVTQSDLDEQSRIHAWIIAAFIGLWISGLTLIYVRTGFVLAEFSPKLVLKVVLMALMSANAVLISRRVLPLLRRNLGRSILDLPALPRFLVVQIAIASMFFWTSGLILGSSVAVKTAQWDVLIPLALGWLAVMSVFGHAAVALYRRFAHSGKAPSQTSAPSKA